MKVLIVADISNLFYSVKRRFGSRLNYETLFNKIMTEDRQLYRAIAYGAAFGNEADRFKKVLNYIGFETKYKTPQVYDVPQDVNTAQIARDIAAAGGEWILELHPEKIKQIIDASGIRPTELRKADWDVGMAMDVVIMLDSVDIVVFATADGDMAPCIEYVKSRGKIAEVIGCCISSELKNVANKWTEIGEDLLDIKEAA